MYNSFRHGCERLLRIPHEPTPPPGDERSAQVFRAAPAYLKYQMVLWLIGVAAVFFVGMGSLITANVAAFASTSHTRGGDVAQAIVLAISVFVMLLLCAHAAISFAMLRLNYEKRWYVVTDRSLRIREGVIVVREMTVTFANIQNLSVMQGPIQRALGLADLKVETAGGGSSRGNEKQLGPNLHTAWFRGIDNAEEVKQLIQRRLRALKDSGLGDHDGSRAVQIVPAASEFLDALRAVHAEAADLRAAIAQT